MEQPSRATVTSEPAIYLALELGDGRWKLALATGVGRAPRERSIKAGDLTRMQTEIRQAKERFGLPSAASLTSCYEAGRNGFWLHRYLRQQGIDNHVVDPSSIHVQRYARQAKTDRLDVHRLLQLLLRFAAGEREVWSVTPVPRCGEAEKWRWLTRQIAEVEAEQRQEFQNSNDMSVEMIRRLMRPARDRRQQRLVVCQPESALMSANS